jgi:hypothetical protein
MTIARLITVCVICGSLGVNVSLAFAELRVSPAAIVLDRPEASQQVLVTDVNGEMTRDVTREVRYEIADSTLLAKIDNDGLLRPVGEGTSQLIIRHGAAEVRVPVTVSGLQNPVPVSFANEVLPILTKGRCNSGGCHGKAEGQNGFKLSLFGFDAAADYEALVKEGKGRRVLLIDPEHSMLIQKGTAQVPHGGGLKIERDSAAHHRLRRWIAEGATFYSATFSSNGERGGVSPPVLKRQQLQKQPGD